MIEHWHNSRLETLLVVTAVIDLQSNSFGSKIRGMVEVKKYRAFDVVRDITRTELRHFTAALRQVQEEAKDKRKSESPAAEPNSPNQAQPVTGDS